MIRVMLVDDERPALEELEYWLTKYQDIQIVSMFHDAYEAFEQILILKPDVVFLDIEMSAPNGYEVAQKLHMLQSSPLIVFVTKSSKYTLKGYGLVFRYLLKPFQEKDLTKVLDEAILEIKSNRLSFRYDGSLFSIPISSIIYAESCGHISTIHTETTEYIVRQTLTDLLQQLPPSLFSFPHKSYLINMQHVLYASSKEIQMSNHDLIPISRRKRETFNFSLNNFLGR